MARFEGRVWAAIERSLKLRAKDQQRDIDDRQKEIDKLKKALERLQRELEEADDRNGWRQFGNFFGFDGGVIGTIVEEAARKHPGFYATTRKKNGDVYVAIVRRGSKRELCYRFGRGPLVAWRERHGRSVTSWRNISSRTLHWPFPVIEEQLVKFIRAR